MGVPDQELKKQSIAGLCAMIVLLVGAFVFYKERVLFADSSFIAFNVINNKSLCIQEHRYGSFITQLAPFLGQKLHLPLRSLLIGYSASFNIFYCFVAALLIFVFRQYRLAILMSLYYFLFVSMSYFWPNDEIHQAVAWMFLLLGVTRYSGAVRYGILFIFIFALLAFLTISTHFIVIIPLTFLWAYLWIEKTNWPFSGKMSVLLSGLLAGVFLLKYLLTNSSTYDGAHFHRATHFSLQDIFNVFTSQWVKLFFYRCQVNYWIGCCLMIVGSVNLFIRKRYLLFSLVLVFFIGYIVVIGLTYADSADAAGNIYLFHIETEWVCISIIAAAPFVFSVLPLIRPKISMIMLTGIFAIRLFYMGRYLPLFQDRLVLKQQIFEQMTKRNIQKLAIVENPLLRSRLILDWALPEETMLASMLNGDKHMRTFIIVSKDDTQRIKDAFGQKFFYTAFGVLAPRNTNFEYFAADTSQGYQVMTFDALIK
jgi:hypothetical protein